jgi:fermentation-respiration switch protein FrsA (DUF1100 family)
MIGKHSRRVGRWRCGWRVLAWVAGIYVATLVVLLACEDRLAFPGWTFRKPWLGPPVNTVVEEASIATADGNAIQAWWLPPAGWTPAKGAVIYLHGNGENLSNCGKALRNWRNELQRGVLGFDYPGFGHSTGTPNEQSCYAAAQACFDWLVHEKKVRAMDIVVIGQSMGGAMATELASRQRCRMLLTSGAFTSFPEIAQHDYFWFPARYLVHLQFDNLAKMGKLETPVFICHGTDDHTVPFSYGERLYAAVTKGPKRFYAAPGHGHSQPDTDEFYGAVRQFLKETGREEAGVGQTSNTQHQAPPKRFAHASPTSNIQ